jgi:hypothetical protein
MARELKEREYKATDGTEIEVMVVVNMELEMKELHKVLQFIYRHSSTRPRKQALKDCASILKTPD